MRCLIIRDEITPEECELVQAECYKKRKGKELPKKFKRIVGWNYICSNCDFHKGENK